MNRLRLLPTFFPKTFNKSAVSLIFLKSVLLIFRSFRTANNKRAGAVPDDETGLIRVRAYLIGQLAKNKAIHGNPLNPGIILEEI